MGTLRRLAVVAGISAALLASGHAADAAKGPVFFIGGVGAATPAKTIDVTFNPKEYTIDKAVPWRHHDASVIDAPTTEFTAGEPYRLEVVLLFDTYESRTSVLAVTGALEQLVSKDRNDPDEGPDVAVRWGGRDWITRLLEAQTKVVDRSPDGTALAAAVRTVWSEFVEVVDPPPEVDPIPAVLSSPRGEIAASLDANAVRFLTEHPSGDVTARRIPIDPDRGLPRAVAFEEGDPHRLYLNLCFDTLAQGTDVRISTDLLRSLVEPGRDKRPPLVTFQWGDVPQFDGVVGSLSVRYTLFLPSGTPVRATVTVHVTEAQPAQFRRSAGDEDSDDDDQYDGEEGDGKN